MFGSVSVNREDGCVWVSEFVMPASPLGSHSQ